jgi:hypothetical protein
MIRRALQNSSVLTALALILATIAFTKWGYFWYAVLLDDVWQDLIGRTEVELIALAEARGFLQSFNSLFISFVQACGLLALIRMTKATGLFHYLAVALICGALLVIPALGNAVLFAGQSSPLWGLDSVHFLCGYLGMALVFWLVLEGFPTKFRSSGDV